MSVDFSKLGPRIAAVQDRQVASLGAAEKAREGFLGHEIFHAAPHPPASGPKPRPPAEAFGRSRRLLPPNPRARRTSFVVALVAAAFAGAVATFVTLRTRDRALAFSVGDEPFAGSVPRRISASGDRPVPVHFSDGSEVEIEAHGRLVIKAVDRLGAVAELESGHTSVKVVHRASTRWALQAGPYTVDVVGTRFELEWKPESARLLVHLEEGRVVVKGGSLASPVPVAAGQVLVAADGTWQLTPVMMGGDPPYPLAQPVTPPPAHADPATSSSAITPPEAIEQEAPPPASVAAASAEARPLAEPQATTTPSPKLPAPTAPAQGWQELAQAGNYDEALAVVERDGFDAACRSSSAGDLMALAETARLAKHPARARQALLALRDRFPGNTEASTAAFYLGRMAGDREAAEWFRTYLREAPAGALRREASGRLLEALSRGGDTAAAADAARSYLKQYPHGPHASLAARLAPP